MTTRIYQGRIISARYEDPEYAKGEMSAMDALIYTYRLFQEATNYHMVALAGMAEKGDATIGMRFNQQMRSIWDAHPRGKAEARTLQQSVTETLNLPPTASFDEAVEAIFADCEDRSVLPYVQQLIMDRTQKGDGAIQQEGRGLLPKLCDVGFSGNYDYSAKEKAAAAGRARLMRELGRDDITLTELEALANEMDLSWAAIKTQPNADHSGSNCYTQEETIAQVKAVIEALCEVLRKRGDKAWDKYAQENGINWHEVVQGIVAQRPVINSAHLLAKNNKAAPALKQAAVFFMYYPCKESAQLLKIKLGKEKVEKEEATYYDYSSLANDPILLARGSRGYVYRGYTALPEWQQEGAEMYSTEWDILAFKEALKTLHSYELKTQERNSHVASLQKVLDYMREGKGSAPGDSGEGEGQVAVLAGDPRYELLLDLVQEISPDDETAYTISRRALNAYEEVREQWLKAERAGAVGEDDLKAIVRKVQGSGTRFGAGVLFEAMCAEKYRPIWHPCVDTGKKALPRSENILRDFSRVQELEAEIEQYSRPIKITAAEPVYSARQLLFSDISNFGVKKPGHEYVKGQKGVIKLRVAVRDSAGHLEGATILVKYSAPRFERDELGVDARNWLAPKKGEDTSLPWLQPMMKALGVNEKLLHLEKEPAVALQVKAGGVCLLNFPVTLNTEPLHQYMGKAALWKNQMLGGQDEKLHLHWPGTYGGKELPWWRNAELKQRGFDVLGVDLGVRYAAAWSLTHVQREPQLVTSKGTVLQGRCVGTAEGESWYGYSRKQGLIKIDGEGHIGRHYESRENDSKPQAPDGVTRAFEEDLLLAESIMQRVGITRASFEHKNVLEIGNDALWVFTRLLSRFRTYQSLVIKLKDDEKWESAMAEAQSRCKSKDGSKSLIPGIDGMIERGERVALTDAILSALLTLRADLPQIATDLVNLLLPRKQGHWQWVEASKPGYICSGRIELVEGGTPSRKVFHRGGLSVSRLTQLEKLRQSLQSLNRVLWMQPGVTTPFGRDLKDIPVVDPCPDVLTKIENVREQRVNKMAHDIVAQALGVRLVKSRSGKNADGRDIIHGEYEVIPGRTPVDFVVLENLSAYLTSVDKTPEENSTLMRWAHRQLVAKVKQLLEEVFGIPVLCTHAAYTSKFDALTSAPGFRARELTEGYLKRMLQSSKEEEQRLGAIYTRILENVPAEERPTGIKLIAPDAKNGGEYFVSSTAQGVRVTNADINAAINIAWRGIAAPEALDMLHRVRLEQKKGGLQPCSGNKREKALKGLYTFSQHRGLECSGHVVTAFRLDENQDMAKPFAAYGAKDDSAHRLVYGRDLWGAMKERRWLMCNLFNLRLLENLTLTAQMLKDYMVETGKIRDDDELPM